MTAVRFIDVPNMVRWVSDRGPETIIAEMAAVMDEDFRRWPEFDKSARMASHSAGGVIELMPTSDAETYAFKFVNGHPANPVTGLQTVTAFGVLADVATGYPVFLAEMTILTALRTAAASALAGRLLARPDSRVMALIGTGSQSEFQALGFRALCGINTIRAWDTDPEALAKFLRNARRLGFDVHIADSAADAVEGADVITICTAEKVHAEVLSNRVVVPGVHINAVGGDCPGKTELEPAILPRSRVFVEYTPQTRVEGEIQRQAPDFPVTELWEVLVGSAVGREAASDITVFDSVGFAIEDFSALRYAHRSVAGTEFCTLIDLVADPVDPKDLFGFATAATAAVAVPGEPVASS